MNAEYQEAIRAVEQQFYQKRVEGAQNLYGPQFNAAAVCRHITDDRLIKEFARCLEFPSLEGSVSFEQQGQYAEHIVKEANGRPINLNDISSNFLGFLTERVRRARTDARQQSEDKETEEERALRLWDQQIELLEKDIRRTGSHGSRLLDLVKEHPSITFRTDARFRWNVQMACDALNKLNQKLNGAHTERVQIEEDKRRNRKTDPHGNESNIVIEEPSIAVLK
jgi:hypothetical protein